MLEVAERELSGMRIGMGMVDQSCMEIRSDAMLGKLSLIISCGRCTYDSLWTTLFVSRRLRKQGSASGSWECWDTRSAEEEEELDTRSCGPVGFNDFKRHGE